MCAPTYTTHIYYEWEIVAIKKSFVRKNIIYIN